MIELKKQDAALARILPEQEPRLGVRYVPSQFALSFSHRGKRFVYHTLTTRLLETELPESHVWSGASEENETAEALIRGLFLVPEGKDECGYYNSVSALMRQMDRKSGNQSFVILPTLRCNARCVYCYEAGREQSTMGPETVEATLRYILETHAGEPVWLTWFGGEPLLCPDIIDRICTGLREAGLPYRCKMITNGSLITPAVIEKMLGLWNIKRIQISMDGAEADYIARKQYRVYRDDYHRIMESVSRLSEAGISVVIRCNVDEENWDRVPEFIRDLGAGITHKEKVRIYYALLNDVRAGENALSMWKKVVEARGLAAEVGFRPSTSYSSGLRFRAHFCMAGSGTAVICPDGRICPCEHCPPESFFGTVFEGTTDPARRAEFCREDRTREKCRDCPFLPVCTNFASCPTPQRDCRGMRELFLMDELKCFLDRRLEKSAQEESEADGEIC